MDGANIFAWSQIVQRSRLPARFQVQEVFYELNDDVTGAVNSLDAFAPTLTMVVGFPPDIRKTIALAKTKARGSVDGVGAVDDVTQAIFRAIGAR